MKAAYWLSDRCHVDLRHDASGRLFAEIRTKDGTSISLDSACGEFCSALTDFALRARVSAETAEIQQALLSRAFTQLLPRADGG